MSTPTKIRSVTKYGTTGRTARDYETVQLENGNFMVKGVRIFRTGTFRDSMGVENTWTAEDLDLVISHFHFLVEQEILPDVPLREDHSISVEDVVGYIRDIYRDAEDDQYLAADFEFTEAAAYAKWKSGTYRNRSAELGPYETNDNLQLFPVLWGVAFVPIPAVEGLHGKQHGAAHFYLKDDKESPIMDELTKWIAEGKSAEDWVKAVNYAKALEDHEAQAKALGIEAPAPATPPAPASHSKDGVASTFMVNGQPMTDAAAVQSYINGLEQFRKETADGVRTSFVDELIKAHKIPGTARDETVAFALSLTPDQFESYRKAQEALPVHSLFGTYGDNSGAGGGNTSTMVDLFQNAVGLSPEDELVAAAETVANHKRSGQSAEFIKGTASYKTLEAAGKAPAL